MLYVSAHIYIYINLPSPTPTSRHLKPRAPTLCGRPVANTHRRLPLVQFFLLTCACEGVRAGPEGHPAVRGPVDPLPDVRAGRARRGRGLCPVAVRAGAGGLRPRVPFRPAVGRLRQVGDGGQAAAERHGHLRQAAGHAHAGIHVAFR